jgi:hypothetical protein
VPERLAGARRGATKSAPADSRLRRGDGTLPRSGLSR